MKIKLLRDSKVTHKAGEIVNASPTEAAFLISVHSAIEIRDEQTPPQPVKETRVKRSAKQK